MPSRNLPSRPSLDQHKRQAAELQRGHAHREPAAAARIIAHHPRFASSGPNEALASPFALADAQLVIAREYGFKSWAALKHEVEAAARVAVFRPHPRFGDAVAAIDGGDVARLDELLTANPELVHARTNLEPPYHYFAGATLLHHVAWNPGRSAPVPPTIVEIARLLIDRGADVNAVTLGRNGGPTLGLLVTSKKASDANVSGPLLQLLIDRGAEIDLTGQNVLDASLANHAPRAAEKLIALCAKPDIFAAAALGRMDLLRGMFDTTGRLRSRPRRHGAELSERDAIGLALLFAYVNAHPTAVDFLLEKDGNWNMIGVNNGTALHRAAWDGDLAMVQRLIAKGADIGSRENPFMSSPLSWAQHNKQPAVFDWLRANATIDLHDAVSFGLREHVDARLAENPADVNKQIDHWQVPRSTPLYWACLTMINDIDGTYALDLKERLELVRLLLDRGAEPNIVCGNGRTALDFAEELEATQIVELLRRHGARKVDELQPPASP